MILYLRRYLRREGVMRRGIKKIMCRIRIGGKYSIPGSAWTELTNWRVTPWPSNSLKPSKAEETALLRSMSNTFFLINTTVPFIFFPWSNMFPITGMYEGFRNIFSFFPHGFTLYLKEDFLIIQVMLSCFAYTSLWGCNEAFMGFYRTVWEDIE